MKAEQVINKLLNATGQTTSVVWKSDVQPSASHKDVKIEKLVKAVVRSGINYAHLQRVKAEFDRGERTEVKPLKWGHWIRFPYLIGHTPKTTGEYTEYIRLYTSPNKNQVPKVTYLVNGSVATKEQVAQFLTPSKARELLEGESSIIDTFTLTASNVQDVE